MAYSSPTYPNEIVIDDSTSTAVTHPREHARGLIAAVGYKGTDAEPFPSSLLAPVGEWQARIEEMDATKTRLSDMILKHGIPPHDQDGIPYCWIHGPTGAVEVVRTCIQNQPFVALSATSAGCIIKNFRKEGGWGKEGLEFIANRGVVPQSMWPENKLQKSYDTPANWEEAKKHVCTEWWELKPRNNHELISCLLHRIPVAVGYNWWGHEVYACDAVWKNNTVVIRIRNSWGNWGDKGFGLLEGSKMTADDAVAPRVQMGA